MTRLTFGLDFDDTFTACPTVWKRFIDHAEELGHRIILVTSRRDTEENNEEIRGILRQWEVVLPIVFASLGSKLHAVAKRDIKVDIWIDDNPVALVNGH